MSNDVEEINGMTVRECDGIGGSQESALTIRERTRDIVLNTSTRRRFLTPAQAHYLANKLHAMAYKIEERLPTKT